MERRVEGLPPDSMLLFLWADRRPRLGQVAEFKLLSGSFCSRTTADAYRHAQCEASCGRFLLPRFRIDCECVKGGLLPLIATARRVCCQENVGAQNPVAQQASKSKPQPASPTTSHRNAPQQFDTTVEPALSCQNVQKPCRSTQINPRGQPTTYVP